MEVKSEVTKTIKMVKDAGFDLADVQFEGVLQAKNAKVIEVLAEMSKKQQAIGVMRIYYQVGDDVRAIEIPVGEIPEMPME